MSLNLSKSINNKSIKTKPSKKPSNNRFATLKKKMDNKSGITDFSQKDLIIKVEYEKEDINIIYKYVDEDEVEISIKKNGNDTNCVLISYDLPKKEASLISLLFDVPKDDKCRINASGTYYLDLIFIVMKILLNNNKINFKPSIFYLADGARKVFPFSNGEELSLSGYKLLTEGRTFYEGYGFINYWLGPTTEVNYKKLEDLLSLRRDILELPINKLEQKILDEYKIPADKPKQYKLPEITQRLNQLISMLNSAEIDSSDSISTIFKNLLARLDSKSLSDEQQLNTKKICTAIVLFIEDELVNIIKGILKLQMTFLYTYIINIPNMDDYYKNIISIYDKYNISIYEDYLRYISILPDDK